MSIHCFDENPAEAYFRARLEIHRVAHNLADKYDIYFGPAVISSKPQYAFASPISEALLEINGAGEIKTPNAHFNRSKGRCADMELTTLEHAEKILEMPYRIDSLIEVVTKLCDEVRELRNR